MSRRSVMAGACAAALLGLGAGLSAVTVPAAAQTSTYRSASVQAGKSARLAVVTPFKKDCSVGELGGVRVVNAPKHGALTLKRGKLKTPADFRCPNKEAVVEGVFYQAGNGYAGADEVTYETKSAEGEISRFVVQITVTAGAPAAAPKRELQEL